MSSALPALYTQPANRNFLSQLNYRFLIKKMPHVNFFLQKVNIPHINLPPVDAGNPFVSIPHPGDHIQFGNLQISFKIDENLKNYQELYDWLIALGFPQSFEQHSNLDNDELTKKLGYGIKSDCSVLIHDSSNNPKFEIVFADAFPTFLSEINFDSTAESVDFITATALFKYTYFAFNTSV